MCYNENSALPNHYHSTEVREDLCCVYRNTHKECNMKVGFNPSPRIVQLEIPLWDQMEPPIRKLGDPIKRSPIFSPPTDWPVVVLGGLCDDWDINPYRCTGFSEVDSGDGLLCNMCHCIREGWIVA